MIRPPAVLLAAAALLALAGCSSTAAESVPTTATPTPTAAAATEAQVSSVLAAYGDDFRDTIDGAANCRFLWTVGGSSFADKVNAQTCYTTASTANLQAAIVLKKWAALKIPDSMTDLVNSTSQPLTDLAGIDFSSTCGDEALPKDSHECDLLLGQQMADFTVLKTELAAWKPYGV